MEIENNLFELDSSSPTTPQTCDIIYLWNANHFYQYLLSQLFFYYLYNIDRIAIVNAEYFYILGFINMRRKERQVTDEFQIKDFILSEEILRIGFYDKDEIYIVPVNYGFSYNNEKYIFYFHGAKAGRKYELAKLNPKVGFEIDGKYSLVTGDIACDYTAYYQSVIGNGILSIVENTEEKILALNSIMYQTTKKSEWSYSSKMLDAVAIFKLEVEKISCKINKKD